MESGSKPINWGATVWLLVLAASVAFFWVDSPIKLRALNPAINYALYSFVCFLMPISILGVGWVLSKKWLRILSLIIAIVIGIPNSFLGILAFDEAMRIQHLGYDPSLAFLKEVLEGDYRYRLYRTNCGATCAFGLELRKERFFPYGIKLVQPIWSFYGADDGELALLEKEIEVSYDGFVATVKK